VTKHPIQLGLIGEPLGHTLSPVLHETLGELLGFPIAYAPYRVRTEAELPDALRRLRGLGVAGLNVTIPYKVACASLCDVLTPDARAVGAVNTLVFEKEALLGHNTDVVGFARSLSDAGVDARGRKTLVLGAGGAARAAVAHLTRSGAVVRIAARRPAAAQELAEHARSWSEAAVETVPWAARAEAAAASTLLVHATPLGMHPAKNGCALPADTPFSEKQVVCDLVYRPRRTVLLRRARRAGALVVDGLGMLIHQAIAAEELWLKTRIEPTANLVQKLRRALVAELRESTDEGRAAR